MVAAANAELISLLASEDVTLRTVALHWLSEGYASEPAICRTVWNVWDKQGLSEGFPEFPMLSHFPISVDGIEECCQRAAAMVQGAELTSLESRSAGKMLEQLTRLPPQDLAEHLQVLQETATKSKIFFRVDVAGVEARVKLRDLDADALASQLDQSIETLSQNREEVKAVHRGLHALEALRQNHPDYLDLAAVLAATPPDDGTHAISFQLAMQSLVQFPQAALESEIARHLHDRREAIFVTAVDALVRAGTIQAAECLLQAFPQAELSNQQWIARGLQRLRVKGLAPQLAALRAVTQEPRLWLMLLVAEIRQMDLEHAGWLAAEVGRVLGHSYALVNALTIYNAVHAGAGDMQLLQSAFVQYLARTQQSLLEQRADKAESLRKAEAQERRKQNQAREAALKRFREKQ